LEAPKTIKANGAAANKSKQQEKGAKKTNDEKRECMGITGRTGAYANHCAKRPKFYVALSNIDMFREMRHRWQTPTAAAAS
jgi:hypothetical protein